MEIDVILTKLNELEKTRDGNYLITHELISDIRKGIIDHDVAILSSVERLKLLISKVDSLITLNECEDTEGKNLKELKRALQLIGIKKRAEMILDDLEKL